MLYLGDEHIRRIGLHWAELVDSVEVAVQVMDSGDYAQPLKPYLRYKHPQNRIIAMPAYVGGPVQTAGIKWIASFPGNLDAGLPRAHSITLLNNADTGLPYAMLNTPMPSAARTAAVSGLLIRHYLKAHGAARRFRLGIIGFGPVGRLHYDMCCRLYGDRLDRVYLYDIRGPELNFPELAGIDSDLRNRTKLADSWQELYEECNLVITCTVSNRRYIDAAPAAGSLLLDVSLRDYEAAAIAGIRAIIVDDWDEVCRENTDIERLHREYGLKKAGTSSLADVVCRSALAAYPPEEPVLFCPMGMAVFDMAVAHYLVTRAEALGIGIKLK
ncbi:2,3-diaminopropionate biosynthesis protein SbnB [Paenibacillus alkaliterrae]|uniref:2,3-diaminopropionate biosynthesis protein SbnB n=1 Tax=Paenibacillus alkaliterrae TaxID=320909 RepID=UPI001F1D6A28|nr:2,3-diaminopropionate biosynthesis protein SbnB [Paenibacillus alkaliterrae]MCF2939728.1 2,3-diaminopropionate biosynthesis protein SbnB [Paenibacillus alkaliterrae]